MAVLMNYHESLLQKQILCRMFVSGEFGDEQVTSFSLLVVIIPMGMLHVDSLNQISLG
jgi:hypothetical protein